VTAASPHAVHEPARAAEDALTLLRTGRTAMALTVLEPLPDLLREALGFAAAERRRAEGAGARAADAELRARAADARLAVATAGLARLRAEGRDLERRAARLRLELRDLDAAIARRRRALERPDRPPAEPRPRAPKPHELLAEALASGRVTAERVAGLLRVGPADVAPIAAGRVGLPGSAWKRLLARFPAPPVGPREEFDDAHEDIGRERLS
jgi:hypothetical protein